PTHAPTVRGRVQNLQTPEGKPVAGAGPGNRRALVHGVHAKVALGPRAEELAEAIRAVIPVYTGADEPMVRSAAMVAAQVETGNTWIAEHGWFDPESGEPYPLMRVLPTLHAELRRLLDALGCSPTSRARLGLDLIRSEAIGQDRLRTVEGAAARA